MKLSSQWMAHSTVSLYVTHRVLEYWITRIAHLYREVNGVGGQTGERRAPDGAHLSLFITAHSPVGDDDSDVTLRYTETYCISIRARLYYVERLLVSLPVLYLSCKLRLSSTTTSATRSDRNDVIVQLRASRDRTRTDSRRQCTGRRHRWNSTGTSTERFVNESQFGYRI